VSFLFEPFQFGLELRELPVAQLRDLVQIVRSLGLLHFQTRCFDLLA
jgi:hypothetical protein